MSWESIKHRYSSMIPGRSWWACIDREGNWVDSSMSFKTAVQWCAMDAGCAQDLSFDDMIDIITREGYTIVHSDWLPRLADAGLVK